MSPVTIASDIIVASETVTGDMGDPPSAPGGSPIS